MGYTKKEIIRALLQVALRLGHPPDGLRKYLVGQGLIKAAMTQKGKEFILNWFDSL